MTLSDYDSVNVFTWTSYLWKNMSLFLQQLFMQIFQLKCKKNWWLASCLKLGKDLFFYLHNFLCRDISCCHSTWGKLIDYTKVGHKFLSWYVLIYFASPANISSNITCFNTNSHQGKNMLQVVKNLVS